MKAPFFWQKRKSALAFLLAPFGFLYAYMTQRRLKKNTPYDAKTKVICIGNLSVGGTGKTPVCLALGDFFNKRGQKFFYLNHGYHSKKQNILINKDSLYTQGLSDEAFILAAKAPTIISKNRKEGALLAEKNGASLLIMDDGFQNPFLHKDFSFLVVDGEKGFGNGRVLPAGPLREPVDKGLARAQAVILIGQDKTGALDLLNKLFQKQKRSLPILKATIQPAASLVDELKEQPLFAFCGIGRPEKFYATLTQAGLKIRRTADFSDHHLYTKKELDFLQDQAQKDGLTLITTRKDAVKLPAFFQEKIKVMDIELIFENEEQLTNLMKDFIL
jgi:tetraacyldisaccharide 4'-kinase